MRHRRGNRVSISICDRNLILGIICLERIREGNVKVKFDRKILVCRYTRFCLSVIRNSYIACRNGNVLDRYACSLYAVSINNGRADVATVCRCCNIAKRIKLNRSAFCGNRGSIALSNNGIGDVNIIFKRAYAILNSVCGNFSVQTHNTIFRINSRFSR